MAPRVETEHGTVEGEARAGSQAFRGIPYARPPVGALRFCPPEPPEPWTGVRPALDFGPSAIQPSSNLRQVAAQGAQSEDCLYLNVYTPAADGGRRPVMFWTHGGAFIMGSGSSDMYDGAALVERGDVVVVTINYRLGAFGYLSLARHGGDAWGAAPNAGLRDIVAALGWVRRNIGAFGGDPDNVTVFGESAGSMATCLLLAMPSAAGLFQRAICQSGARPKNGDLDMGAAAADKLLAELGIDPTDSQALQEVPAERLLAAQQKASPQPLTRRGFYPIVDGDSVPVDVGDAMRGGSAADVPLIVGTNRDEQNLFILPLLQQPERPMATERARELVARELPHEARDRAGDLLEAYRKSRTAQGLPHSNFKLVAAIQGDARFRIPSTRVIEAREAGPIASPTRVYLFTHASPAARGNLGACHALEIPFVFGTLDKPFQDRFCGTGEAVERLSANMMDAWLAFAHGDDPGHPGLGEWAPYDVERRATMVLGPGGGLQDDPLGDERAAWDGVL